MKQYYFIYFFIIFVSSCNDVNTKSDFRKLDYNIKNLDSMNRNQLIKYYLVDFDSIRKKYHAPIGSDNYFSKINSASLENPDNKSMPRVEIISTFIDYKSKKLFEDITEFRLDSFSRISICFKPNEKNDAYMIKATLIKTSGQSPNIKAQYIDLSTFQYDSIVKKYNDTLLNYKP